MRKLVLLIAVIFLWSCNPNSRGFVLPEGDVEAGKAAFVELKCNQCHSVADIAWIGEGEDVEVPLGGEVTRLKAYGELVTSVINPSHRIASPYLREKVAVEGVSNMKNYNQVMTVQELVDIVSFLQTEYEVTLPSNHYTYHYY